MRDTPLGELGIAVQQRTEIVRALVRNARVMLFDEPNSALTPDESAEFFRLVRQLAAAGHVILLISHRLTELAALSDRVVVIVDGKSVRVLEGARAHGREHRRDAGPRLRWAISPAGRRRSDAAPRKRGTDSSSSR